jgi:hypothetical protein
MLKVVRIGYQKYGSFNVVKRGIKISWILFPAGPQLLEAMNAGAIDLGHTGEAPPIFAKAANNPFVYVGNQRPDPSGEAILVAENSPIKTAADLKEKKSRSKQRIKCPLSPSPSAGKRGLEIFRYSSGLLASGGCAGGL